jgi:hypothetical protein
MSLVQVENYLTAFSHTLSKKLISKAIARVEPQITEEIEESKLDETLENCINEALETDANSAHNQKQPFNTEMSFLPTIRDYDSEDERNEQFDLKQLNLLKPRAQTDLLPRYLSVTDTALMSGTSFNTEDISISQGFDDDDYSENSTIRSKGDVNDEIYFQKYKKQGWLSKKSSNFFIGWQKRYLEVKDFKIYYSKSDQTLKTKSHVRCINLQAVECEIHEHKGQMFSIGIEGIKSKLKLKAASVQEANEWVIFFKELFQFMKDNHLEASKYFIQSRKKILKSDVMTEEEFLKECQNGDILLCQGKTTIAAVQRAFMHSAFDHVSLIVRYGDEIFIYEAAQGSGVNMLTWEDFKKKGHYLSYERLACRKLTIPDNDLREQFNIAIANFVAENIGKKYNLSLKKFFKTKQNNNPESSRSDSMDSSEMNSADTHRNVNQDGFFCSELVASAYKLVGLLDPNTVSARYLPVHFTQKKHLKLLKGAKLSNEYGLILNNESF